MKLQDIHCIVKVGYTIHSSRGHFVFGCAHIGHHARIQKIL